MTSPTARPLLLLALLLPASACWAAQTPQEIAWNTLRDAINDKSADRRSKAARALGLLSGDSRAAALAETALQDAKPEVRAAGAAALGEMLSRASIPKLKNALSDKDGSVVLAAALSLVTLKDPKGYDVYYAVLTGRRKTGQERASQGLRVLQDPKKLAEFSFEEGVGFVPFGGLGLAAFSMLTKDDVSPVRAAAARLLAHDHDPQTGEALGQAVSDKSGLVRAAALEAIAKRGDHSLLSDIQPALSDDNDLVRYTAAAAVIKLTRLERAVQARGKR